MDKLSIDIQQDDSTFNFEVIDYVHDDDNNSCKFEVFVDSKFVASFNPDRHGFLHICKNPGNIDQGILHLLADKIEPFIM